MSAEWTFALHALKKYWGYPSFRPPQDQVVKALIAKQDTFVFLPTGYGKSVCFQVPALLGSGVTLVISPLIALMEDQVQDLQTREIAAAALHGELSKLERKQVLTNLERNRLRLLYLAPETLFSAAVWTRLQDPRVGINALMIDEAHTLVHWGDSFRPDYRRLGAVRAGLHKHFPVAAFTATADPYTRQVLQQVLQLQQPQIIQVDPLRANLHLRVATTCTPADRKRRLLHYLRQQPGTTGLIYVRTRVEARSLHSWLQEQGFQTAAYHGGLASEKRRELEQAWLAGDCKFLICTNAFGMGINKADVRWVAHYQAPMSVTDYIQEVGRGGRDGKVSTAFMLVSEPTGWLDPGDRQRQAFFLSQKQKIQTKASRLLQSLPAVGHLDELVAAQGREVKVALALLHQAGCLQWQDPFHFQLMQRPQHLPDLRPKHMDRLFADPLYAMEHFIQSRECRWQALLRCFGCEAGDPCGNCDNCQRSYGSYSRYKIFGIDRTSTL
ncbi:MAG: ATP-dependent DNA helicase RecQ [Synechococcaceae cyanobacterium SM2_3_1]|nr:ATP-dependent DNA helicase RecQ [Synechococcaceae cyanobacterium SM2_3_1]